PDQIFEIPLTSGDRRGAAIEDLHSQARGGAFDARERLATILVVTHDAALADAIRVELELWFDQGDDVGGALEKPHHVGKHLGQRDERAVDDGEVDLLAERFRGHFPDVLPVVHDDPRIGGELPGELAVAHADRAYAGGPVLQEAVAEAAGRCPDVDRDAPRHGQLRFTGALGAERTEGPRELDPPARHIGMLLAEQLDRGVALDERAGFDDLLP